MAPDERKKQDDWARDKLKAGSCVVGFHWLRISGGYKCAVSERGEGSFPREIISGACSSQVKSYRQIISNHFKQSTY
jgi:hypothetical protein